MATSRPQAKGRSRNERRGIPSTTQRTTPLCRRKDLFVKAARSTMLEVKQEPQTMAEKKKRTS